MTKTQTLLFKRILPAVGLAVLLTVVVFVLEAFGALRQLERVTYDIVAQLPLGNAKPSPVVLVLIEDQDYQVWFNNSSPLVYDGKNNQGGNLKKLIDKIAGAKPAVIGVDIDTSDPRFANLYVEHTDVPIVWEQEIREGGGRNVPVNEAGEIPVLGGRTLPANSTGVPFFPSDQDGVIRFYARTKAPEGTVSLPWAILKAWGRCRPVSDDKRRLILYSNPSQVSRARFSMATVLAMQINKEENPFDGKVVMIGGSFLGLDRHETPMGEMLGVELLANVIETDIRTECKGGPAKLSEWAALVLLFFQNLIFVIVLRDWKSWSAKRWVFAFFVIVGGVWVVAHFRNVLAVWSFVTPLASLFVLEILQKVRELVAEKLWSRVSGTEHNKE